MILGCDAPGPLRLASVDLRHQVAPEGRGGLTQPGLDEQLSQQVGRRVRHVDDDAGEAGTPIERGAHAPGTRPRRRESRFRRPSPECDHRPGKEAKTLPRTRSESMPW